MERTEVLDMMGELKLYGMKAAYDETLATALEAQARAAALRRRSPARRDLGEAGAVDQVSDHRLQAAARQGSRRLRVQGHADQRGARSRSRRRRLHRPAAQRRVRRRNRNRQVARGDRHRAKLHPRRTARPLLHHRRSRQPARGRDARRAAGPHRRLSHPHGLRRPRRARLPAVRPGRRPASLPPRQPALRAHLDPSSPPISPSANGRACSATQR